MQTFVLDTNIFFNLEQITDFGENTSQLLKNLVPLIERLKKSGKAEFFMPKTVYLEFISFFSEETEDLKKFLSLINIKNPEREKILIPGNILAKLIKEIRQRSHRGLKIAEEEIKKTAKEFSYSKKAYSQKELQIKLTPIINKLRERYRNAIRTGFIDSEADVDLILLSKELNAVLISTDEGLLRWADLLGVKNFPAKLFKKKLLSLI